MPGLTVSRNRISKEKTTSVWSLKVLKLLGDAMARDIEKT